MKGPRVSHDMYNGLPDWAIPGTHITKHVRSPERFVEKLVGNKTTNKMIAWVGHKRHEDKMCDVYVYYYDNQFYGRFIAEHSDAKYLVYMNKTHDAQARDAYKWLESSEHEESDFKEIISEVAFRAYCWKGVIRPSMKAYFVTDVLTEH